MIMSSSLKGSLGSRYLSQGNAAAAAELHNSSLRIHLLLYDAASHAHPSAFSGIPETGMVVSISMVLLLLVPMKHERPSDNVVLGVVERDDVVDDVDEGDVILDLRREYVAPVAHGPLAAIAVAPGGGLEMRPGSRTPVWRCFHLTSWVEEL